MSRSPIDEAKAATPWWFFTIQHYDGLEVHPVQDVEEANGVTYCEQCEPEEADFWSVYGHLKTGGVECLDDFPDRAKALAFAKQLLAAYPHLREYGILGGDDE